ncbi:MAG: alpha/beta fold hydrolase [Actinomycetota bacterium]|nr:alpha/beta fold hydrolase [Actinomycetota bacterium]
MALDPEIDRESTRRSAQVKTESGQLTLNYHEAGEATEIGGGLPLVMLHGGGPGASSWGNFGTCLPLFADRFHTILLDQPGFGDSEKTEIVGNFFSFAADSLLAFLDELGIERVHLLGNSLGGGTAARFALQHPERVGRLVLMGPGGLSLNLFHADPTEGIKRLYDFSGNPSKESLEAFMRTMVVNQDLITPELVAERFEHATAPGAQQVMASMGASMMKPDTYEDGLVWRDAHKLRRPVLLTWGREDRVNPLDGALIGLKLIPKAELHVFANCGHWAQIERAEEFFEVASTFLDRHRERARP